MIDSAVPLEEPSLAAWRRVVAALDRVQDPAALDRELAHVEAACAHFPAALRRAPGRWLRRVLEGQSEPRLRVTRTIDFVLRADDASADRWAWADARELAQATIVRVLDEGFGDAGLERWLRSSSHADIDELALATGITERGAMQLADDPRLARLSSLALFRNAIGPLGLTALLGSPGLGNALRRLLLGRNRLARAGARALVHETAIGKLELLDLDCNQLDGEALCALIEAPLLRGVRVLNLSNNPVGRAGCAALAECRYFDRLEVLFLHGTELDDDAVAPLLRAPWLPRLRNLALSENHLSMTTIERLSAHHELTLRELDICHNACSPTTAETTLRRAPHFAALQRLCV